MLFNSWAFAIFLPIVFVIYWLLPNKYRWALLLVASYYFYMSWNAKYVFLILFTTVVSYVAAVLIERTADIKRKKAILCIAAILGLAVLFFFKYFNFATTSVARLLEVFAIHINPFTLKWLLPVGISFYTFQTISYVCDVYRGELKAERHFGKYAAFVAFFPQLVAGPIERTSNLLPQIKEEKHFDYNQATYGLKLMAWGFFKKLVIADTLSQYVSAVYDSVDAYNGFALVLATLFFTIQIYCDFSGYSDIAIGCAKLLGINLMTNFKSPYFSQSVKEFWRRWHISLSTWFRDYVYIPLGGNRVGKARHAINLLITFLVSGLWHGANWTFVVWGGLHGLAQIIENILSPKKNREANKVKSSEAKQSFGHICSKWLKILIVFTFCGFAWIFFVSNSLSDAFYVIGHLFTGIMSPVSYLKTGFIDIGMDMSYLVTISLMILIMAIYDYCALEIDVIDAISKKHIMLRWFVYVALIMMIIIFSNKGIAAEFVYFQF